MKNSGKFKDSLYFLFFFSLVVLISYNARMMNSEGQFFNEDSKQEYLSSDGKSYPTGVDTYYYLQLIKDYENNNNIEYVPENIGKIAYARALSYFNDNYDIRMWPVYIGVLCTILVFIILSSSFKTNVAALGALLFTIFPVWLSRSSFGWVDTDPFIMLTMILIFYELYLSARDNKEILPGWVKLVSFIRVINALILSIILHLIWTPGILMVILILVSILIHWLFHIKERVYNIGYGIIFSLIIFFESKFSFHFFYSAKDFILDNFKSIFVNVNPSNSVIPNIYSSIGELASFSNFFSYINPLAFLLISISFIFFVWYQRKKEDDEKPNIYIIAFSLYFLGFLFLSLKSTRFIEFLAFPVSVVLSVMFWRCYLWIIDLFNKYREDKKNKKIKKKLGLVLFIFSLATIFTILPLLIIGPAQITVTKPYATDFDVFASSRLSNTPENAVIMSWWDKGYIYEYYSGKELMLDGGSQNTIKTYYYARMIAGNNLDEAQNIAWMLSCSGSEIFSKFYYKYSGDSLRGIEELNNMLRMPRKLSISYMEKSLDEDLKQYYYCDNVKPYIFITKVEEGAFPWIKYFSDWNFSKHANPILPSKSKDYSFNNTNLETFKKFINESRYRFITGAEDDYENIFIIYEVLR